MADRNKAETKELLDFVVELQENTLDPFVAELGAKPKNLSIYVARTKEDWKDLYGPAGIDVYNHLHPAHGIII
jgi:hypothetical protein